MGILKKIDGLLDRIFDEWCVAVSNVFLMVFTILVFVEVISRYLFGRSFAQISEYSIFLFIWTVFLMMGKVQKERKHINIGLLSEYLESGLKRRWKRVLEIYLHLTVVLFSAAFLYFGVLDTKIYYRVGYHSTLDWVPRYWTWHLALPVGLIGLLFYSGKQLIGSIVAVAKQRGDE